MPYLFFCPSLPRSDCLYAWHGADKNPALPHALLREIVTMPPGGKNAIQGCPISPRMYGITVIIHSGKPPPVSDQDFCRIILWRGYPQSQILNISFFYRATGDTAGAGKGRNGPYPHQYRAYKYAESCQTKTGNLISK